MNNNKSEIEKEITTGFYDDNIITAENLKVGDIVLSNENDNHKWQVVDVGNDIIFKDLDAETFGGILNQTKIVYAYAGWQKDKYKLIFRK